MANVSVTLSAGTMSASASRSPNNARMSEFVDDLIAVSGPVPDGIGGERPMTRQEAADVFVQDILEYMVGRAKGLKRDRLARAADGL